MKRNIILASIAGVLAIALIAVIGLFAALAFAMPTLQASIASAASQPSTVLPSSVLTAPSSATLADLESAYQSIYNQVNPSVVLIETVTNAAPSLGPSPFGNPNQGPGGQQALGSGFVWDTQGNIVTNNHVIDGADQITVTFADGTTMPGKVVATDVDSDLAVVKVNAPANLLKPVQMGDSNALKVGQITIAIGNPYGEQNTMTTGIVSAIGRSLPVDNSGGQGLGAPAGPSYTIPDVVQTDASINPGNSGGVLLDANGKVIGVTQSIESQSGASAGIGFAIPSAIVNRVIPALIKDGKYNHPYLGISGTTLTPALAQAMGLPDTQRGALVATTTANGPAAKAGLQSSTKNVTVQGIQTQVGGDVITAYNGQPVKTFDDLVALLARTGQPGQTATLTVLRNGKEQQVTITLGARPSTTNGQGQ